MQLSRGTIVHAALTLLIIAILFVPPRPLAAAHTSDQATPITMAAGSVPVSTDIQMRAQQIIAAAVRGVTAARTFAITDVARLGDWLVLSVAELPTGANRSTWLLEDALWIGLVLLPPEASGKTGALSGTPEFSALLAAVPPSALSPAARRDLDPLAARPVATDYRFPWEPATRMVYGTLGVHTGGFISGWQAVDFLSDGNSAAGHAPNRLLASAGGVISYVCRDPYNMAIRIGDLIYVHLRDRAELALGRAYAAGDELGQLQTGTFDGNCGWATQGEQWFHVHLAFPPGTELVADGWSLSPTDGLWRRDGVERGPGSWFLAAGDGAPPTVTPTVTPAGPPTSTPTSTPTREPETQPLTALRAVNRPKLDGKLGEWEALPAAHLSRYNARFLEGDAPQPSDLSATLRASWAADTLYFAATITDDVLVGGDDPLIWDDDILELVILPRDAPFQQFSLCVDGRQARYGALISALTLVTSTIPGGWSLEVAIPLAALGGSPLTSGNSLPFTFALWDDDLFTAPGQSHLFWRSSATNALRADWGRLELSDRAYDLASAQAGPTRTPTSTTTRLPISRYLPLP